MEGPVQEEAESGGRGRANGRSAKSAGAFRTISEVAEELDVAQHVLRFWESKFPQVRPLKRGGGRRYYRPEDVDLLRRIRSLLYEEGYTIKGAQKLLKGQRRPPAGEGAQNEGAKSAKDRPAGTSKQLEACAFENAIVDRDDDEQPVETLTVEPALKDMLANMRDELVELRNLLKKSNR